MTSVGRDMHGTLALRWPCKVRIDACLAAASIKPLAVSPVWGTSRFCVHLQDSLSYRKASACGGGCVLLRMFSRGARNPVPYQTRHADFSCPPFLKESELSPRKLSLQRDYSLRSMYEPHIHTGSTPERSRRNRRRANRGADVWGEEARAETPSQKQDVRVPTSMMFRWERKGSIALAGIGQATKSPGSTNHLLRHVEQSLNPKTKVPRGIEDKAPSLLFVTLMKHFPADCPRPNVLPTSRQPPCFEPVCFA